MIYQELYQANGDPAKLNISSIIYEKEALTGPSGTPERHPFPMHCHSFYEVMYVYNGTMTVEYDDHKVVLPAHSLVFFPPLSIHSCNKEISACNLVLQFSPRLLHNLLSSENQHLFLEPSGQLKEQGFLNVQENAALSSSIQKLLQLSPLQNQEYADTYSDLTQLDPCLELQLSAAVLSALCTMMDSGCLTLSNAAASSDIFGQMQFLINKLISSPEEKISMEDAASLVNMSYSNFCRTFSNTFGITYVDFCNKIRVSRAQELLRHTTLSVTEISARLNFGSISYFNRIFKKYTGCTPLVYKKHADETSA